MIFNGMSFTIQEDINSIDLYYSIYVIIKETKLYSFVIYELTKEYRHKIEFDSNIGNPRLIFDMIERFRHRPFKYFHNLNDWISRKDVQIETDQFLEMKRSDHYNEFYTVEQIRLY